MGTIDREDRVKDDKKDYIPDETGFDPRDTNFDGKVGLAERKAAEGSKFWSVVNKALDNQDQNSARANLGQGFGGTVESNSHLAADDDAAKAAIAKEVAKANAGNSPTPEKQAQLNKLDKANEEKLKEFTNTTAGVDDSSVNNNNVTDDTNVSSEANEVVTDAKKDPVSRYKMRSILDAYNAGEIDKDSRDYLILDTLSNFARNLGKDMGNVAAAYSGGSVDNERGTSMWDKRNAAMAQSAIEGEQTGVEGSREKRDADMQAANLYAKRLNNRIQEDRLQFVDDLKKARDKAPEFMKAQYDAMISKVLSGGTISPADIISEGLGAAIKLIPGIGN